MTALVSGLFFQPLEAERSLSSLMRIGVEPCKVSVLMGEEARDVLFARNAGQNVISSLGHGAVQKTSSSLLSNLAAIASPVARNLFCPGVCLVGSGPLVTRLALAGSGGSARSFMEALHGMGVGKSQARHYVGGLRSRGIIVCADVSTACANEVQQMLNFHSEMDCQANVALGYQ